MDLKKLRDSAFILCIILQVIGLSIAFSAPFTLNAEDKTGEERASFYSIGLILLSGIPFMIYLFLDKDKKSKKKEDNSKTDETKRLTKN